MSLADAFPFGTNLWSLAQVVESLEKNRLQNQPAHPMHRWRGESGEWYWFSVFGLNEFYDFDGIVYIITRARPDGYFDPLYIGQSGQGGVRLSRHEKMPQARRLGATHVQVHFCGSETARFSTETDLRRLHHTPLNGQPTPALALGALAALSSLSNPAPSVPSGVLAALSSLSNPVPSVPLSMLVPQTKVRSRSSWNDRMTHWERPASDSEELTINRAANMVSSAISNNRWLNDQGVTILPQGSYYNNTNVRLEADMDLRALHPDILVEYASGVDVNAARAALALYDTGRTFRDVAQEMRRHIISDLTKKFGSSSIDASGNKAIRLKKQPGSRADVDIVQAFRYFWVMHNPSLLTSHVEEGIAILGKDGAWTHNFPEQHHANGIAKRARTKHRFKRNVRILKRLRDELVEERQLVSKQVASFLIECLVYAVEDEHFLFETDERYDRALRILSRMGECLNDSNWVTNATEINEIKYLFRLGQPWTVDDAKAFVLAARRRIEA